MGLEPSDGEIYARVLTDCLGPVAERPLDEPPSYPSFLSDDHTPVEYSLAFVPDGPPTLRVLLEPGYGAEGLAENGRVGLRVVRAMAERWGFATDQLDRLEDLFFPPDPEPAGAVAGPGVAARRSPQGQGLSEPGGVRGGPGRRDGA